MKPINHLLERQFRRNNVDLETLPEELKSLIYSISDSYEHYESSHKLINRAMEISNLELEEANIKLVAESRTQKLLIENLKESVRDISLDGKEIDDDDLIQISKILKTEIKKRKTLEKELLQAQKVAEESLKFKDIFLANMSHEIRTPLNAILGMTWLLSKTDLDEKQKEYKDVLRSASKNLLAIVNDILDLSIIESGKYRTKLIDFNLNKLLNEIINTNSYAANDKGIDLVFESSLDSTKNYSSDPKILNQILLNLISNAIKFTEKGFVKIIVNLMEARPNSDILEFSVIDSGKGIDDANLEKIFNSFYQEDDSIKRKYGGSGLGLTISKELIEFLGGEIIVKSKKNEGTEFSFIIELMRCTSKTNIKSPVLLKQKKSKPNLKGYSILIVEDDEYNIIFLTSILEKCHVNIEKAYNGIEAIEKLKLKEFDLILMDMHMPKMDGISATKNIRSVLKLKTPIIALTADVMQPKEKYIEVGMQDYISKPLKPEKLYELLEDYIL
jgi:signal transduction histidine kinase/CheY-like chemotaxis protein